MTETRLNNQNLSERDKQSVRELYMWLNSSEANPQGEGYPDQQAFTSPSHIWQAYREVYTLPQAQEQTWVLPSSPK